MGRSRIWRNKPLEVVARNRAARAAKKAEPGPLPIPAQASPSATPGKEDVVVDVAAMFGKLSAADRAVAWSLMGNHGMSMWGAVNVVREVKI